MENSKFDDIFKNHFFDGITKEQFLNVNLDKFVEHKFSDSEMLIQQDTEGECMYLISSGEVSITKEVSSHLVELARRSSGDYVGEMALFDNQLRSANVHAIGDVTVYTLHADYFFEIFNGFEEIKINLIKLINSSIRETGEKLGETSLTHDAEISIKDSELHRTRSLLNETIELKRNIDEQKGELELINRELESRNRELYQLTIVDDLTQLYSKQHFFNLLENEYSRSKRYNILFSLLIIDIDDFTGFNKNFGHFTGDRVLKETAGIINSSLYKEDVVGRIDGERFAVILPHQNIGEAKIIADKIIKNIEGNKFIINAKEISVTVSIGISDNSSNELNSCKKLAEQATEALKSAKEAGRNRFVIYP